MASKSSNQSGGSSTNQGNREQFDHFDRLSQVDKQNLNHDKMKAEDKEADVEELLATEDEEHVITSELYGGSYTAQDQDLKLSETERTRNEIPPIEELEKDKDGPDPLIEEVEEDPEALPLPGGDLEVPGIDNQIISPTEAEIDPVRASGPNNPPPPVQEASAPPQEAPEIPVEEDPELEPEPDPQPDPDPDPEPEPVPDPDPDPEPDPDPDPEPEDPDPDPDNCTDHPIPTQLENGNYQIISGAGLTIVVDSLTSNAGFNNSFGHYFADSNGNPIAGTTAKLDFFNVKDTLGEGQEAVIQYESGDIPAGAVQLGFFIIPNGANLNQPSIPDGAAIEFIDVGGIWTPYYNGQPLQGASSPAFFSDTNLNPDGVNHMSHAPGGHIGWEDLFGGGDNDFNDSVLNVTVQSTTDNNGSDDIIVGSAGADTIQGGLGDDVVAGGSGNDTLAGGAGNDIILGNAGDDSLTGGSGHDILKGSGGADTLDGEACDDHLFGGVGSDSLIGGTGHDTIYGGAEQDTITGNEGDDSLLGGTGEDSITGDTGDDTIDGGENADTISGDAGDDSILGGTGDDSLSGGTGADTVHGGSGQDLISGDEGADSLSGGTGADTALGGEGNDTIFGNEGTDSLVGGTGDDSISGGDDSDIITGNAGNDTLTGDAGDDTLTGGTGDDSVLGGAGNDSMDGGEGADTLVGHDGDDTITGGAGADSILGGADNDSLSGGAGADTILGDDGSDTIAGDEGADSLVGNAGNDSIDGGADNDSLSGGIGSDTILGGSGSDTIAGDEGADSLVGNAGNDSIDGGADNDTIQGGGGNDTLAGGAGNDSILGGAGNDSMDGGEGADTLVGHDGDDTITGGAGADSILGGADNDSLSGGIGSDTILGGDGSDTIAGDEGADSLVGNAGDDSIDGGDDNDTIQGGGGNDTLAGGAGDDSVLGGAGNDSMDGGDGADTLVGHGGDDTITGGAGDDSILGGADNDSLSGGTGADTIHGGGGSDTIFGNEGDDLATGGAGRDSLHGGSGDDTLSGNAGDDTLEGESGDDLLIGGTGDDSLVGDNDMDLPAPPPTQLSNGNYDISPGNGFGITFDSISSTAAFQNTFGMYFKDASGDLIEGVIAFANVQDSLGVGDSVTLNYAANDLPPGAVEVGFFIIPNGFGLNNGLVDGATVTFDENSNGDLAVYLDGNELQGAQNAPAYFSDQSLNPDNGFDHMNHTETGQIQLGFEDLFGGGDQDYDDAVINVVVEGYGTNPTGTNNDTLFGGEGTDTLAGGAGDDSLSGGTGDDLMLGGTGADTMFGDQGDDSMSGNEGTDFMDGGEGSDTLSGNAGNDTLEGEEGDDLLIGGQGDDLLIGDTQTGGSGAVPIQLTNGNYMLPAGVGFTIALDSISANAGYDNSLGHYFVDSNGNPIYGVVNFANVKDSLGIGDASSITYAPGDIPPGAVEVGFFIIPDGADLNPSLTDGSEITFTFTGGQWVPVLNGNELQGQGAPIYFSDGSLNSDGVGHMHFIEQNPLQISFEDLPNNGDKDFDDAVANVTVEGIDGPGQNDTLLGGVGNDTALGGAGGDSLDGGAGDDKLDGGTGNDTLVASQGDDTLSGGLGTDKLIFQGASTEYTITDNGDGTFTVQDNVAGRDGTDIIDGIEHLEFTDTTININSGSGVGVSFSGTSDEYIFHNNGDGTFTVEDTVPGRDGEQIVQTGFDLEFTDKTYTTVNNTIFGTDGDDVMRGGDGTEIFQGGKGADTITGGVGQDVIHGGEGEDQIDGGSGDDMIWGGKDADTILGGADNDWIGGDGGDDVIDAGTGDDDVVGNAGDDTIEGGTGQDSIWGGEDEDLIDGGAGDDILEGDEGHDTIDGGDGEDTIHGEEGDDSIDGGYDDDTITGGDGEDTIQGGLGDDEIDGNDGDDVIYGDEIGGGGGTPPNDPTQLDNGNYDLTNTEHFCIEIDSISSNAGYNNSFGHYFADSNGNPISGTVDFANVKDSTGVGDSVVIAYDASDIPAGATQLGFFIIPDGADQNPSLTDGASVTFTQDISGNWSPVWNGNELNGIGSNAFFSQQNLNSDGVDHMSHTTSGQITFGFEDLQGGGDNDFDDVIVNFNIRAIDADPEPFTLGGRDIPQDQYDVDELWNKDLAGHEVTVTPFNNLENETPGEFGFEYQGNITRGIGVKTGDNEINGEEGIRVDLGGLELKEVTVGVRALFEENSPADGVETGSWKAFLDGIEVGSGTFDAVPGSPDGRAEFTINVEGGFDRIEFFSEEAGSDFHLEYIDGVIPAKVVEDYNNENGGGDDDGGGGGGPGGDDTIEGGQGNDWIDGQGGDDVIDGGVGDDTIEGNDGDDIIIGDDGDDSIGGGQGEDLMSGGDGNDTMSGGAGNDDIQGNAGDDSLSGDDGDDWMSGGAGADTMDGGAGDDTMLGGTGTDSMLGGDGDDTIDGGDDNDTIVAGDGDDTVQGADGDDYIEGNDGDDLLFGDDGGSSFGDPTQLANGNFDIEGINHFCIELDSISSNAGYNNSFGHYFADSNGNPISGSIDFTNVKDTLGEGDSVTLQYTANDIPSGATQLGFFIIPDGADKNPGLSDGDQVGFQLISGKWTPTLNGTDLDGQGAPALFSDSTLNPGFNEHMQTTNTGQISFNFEDIAGGGDQDFNDVVVDFSIRTINADPEPFTLGGEDLNADYNVNTLWNQNLAGHQINVTPYSDLENKVEGNFNFKTLGNGEVRGLSVGPGHAEIDQNEGIEIDFDGLVLGEVNVGLRVLFQEDESNVGNPPPDNVETASWKAYLNGVEVGSGTVDGTDDLSNPITDGKVEFTIDIEGGFDQIVLFSEENGSDFGIEFISGEIPAKVVDDYNRANGNNSGDSSNDTILGGTGNDTIDGGRDSDLLSGGEGMDSILGGTGNDTIDGDDDDDKIWGQEGDDDIHGGAGDDWLGGGTGDDTIYGGTGDDDIQGGAGDDDLAGGEGDDWISGDGGIDTIDGGQGDDTILGGTDMDSILGGAGDDSINSGDDDDKIWGQGGDDDIHGGSGDDWLGGGTGDDTIDGGTGDDDIQGGAGDDDLTGGEDDDWMSGGDGADTMDGGSGEDTMLGGTGMDSMLGGENDDVIDAGDDDDKVWGQGGDDDIQGSAGDDWLGGGAGDDTIDGGTGDDDIQGDAGDDTLTGGQGNDWMSGGRGNDTMSGGSGEDTMFGGDDDDCMDGGVGNDTMHGGSGADTMFGGAGADSMAGNAGTDILMGGAGNDTMSGGSEDDTLHGGQGDDSIEGGTGDDLLVGDSNNNQEPILLENGNYDISATNGMTISIDAISSNAGYNNSLGIYFADSNGNPISGIVNFKNVKESLGEGNASTITLGTSSIPFGAVQLGFFIIPDGARQNPGLSDETSVSFAQNDDGEWAPFVDDGNGGTDELHGVQGIPAYFSNESLNPDNFDHMEHNGLGQIQIGFEDLVNGGDQDYDDVIANVTVEGSDVAGRSNDTLFGGEGRDTALGGSGDDLIDGGSGNDDLHGDSGNDTISGGDGDDWIEGGPGNDLLDGEAGNDTIQGNSGDDSILGGDGHDLALGGSGSDTIDGGTGSDTIQGNSGDDSIDGGTGQDILVGGTGDDTILGGSGNDLLVGGKGNDSLSGGDGHDYVVGMEGNDSMKGGAGDDHMYGGAGDDTISGCYGADTIFGGGGSDSITGGIGDDTIYADSGTFIIHETSGFSGWNDNSTETSNHPAATGEYLGRHGDSNGQQALYKTFDISAAKDTVSVEFDIIEIDDWDGSGLYMDEITVFVNNQPVLVKSYDVNVDDGTPNQGGLQDLGYGWYDNDEIHHYKLNFSINDNGTLTLLNPDGTESSTTINALPDESSLKLGFGADMTASINNESWGIDNVKISSTVVEGGDDTISGGAGDDIVVFQGTYNEYNITKNPDGSFIVEDTIEGRDGTDTIDNVEIFQFSDGTLATSDWYEGLEIGSPISGNSGGNNQQSNPNFYQIQGDDVANIIYGTSGQDRIDGKGGDDTIYGRDGNDSIFGGGGDDYIRGGAGDDTIDAGAGNNDIVTFKGNIGDYIIMKNPDSSYTVQENSAKSLDGTDTVSYAEFFCFDDGIFSTEEIDNNYLSSGGGGGVPFELGEIIANDTDDWIQAISEDSNFDDIDPSNWIEDIELESHDHSSEYDEFEKVVDPIEQENNNVKDEEQPIQ